jgi:hypothetical protein
VSRLLITANSPGELAGWVRPILQAWRERDLGPVDILLLPCSFATGQEERVAKELDGVDRVYRPHEYFRLLWKLGADYKDGYLLHLGGDLMYSAFLSWRWGMSTWSYLWARPWWNSAFDGYFTKNEWGVNWLKKRKVPPQKIHLTGDLVLDAVRQHVPKPAESRLHQISYLPGSRSEEVASLTPFFLSLHKELSRLVPGTDGVLHLSPFIPQERAKELLQSQPHPAVGGIKGAVKGDKICADGVELTLATSDSYQRLSRSELAISIPGTKTAEAGYLRTPVVTLVPLNRPEHLPSIGLAGLLDFIPGGSYFKGLLMLRLAKTIGLVGHPNMLAKRALLPEFMERIEVNSLTEKIGPILADKERLREVSVTLQSLYPWSPMPASDLVETMIRRG